METLNRIVRTATILLLVSLHMSLPVNSLERTIDTSSVKSFISAMKDKELIVRVTAIYALEKICDVRAVEPLIAVLKDKESVVRQSAARVLGRIGDARAVEPLFVAWMDENGMVWMSAAHALGVMGDARAVEFLMTILNDKSKYVRVSAVCALVRIGGPGVEPFIADLKEQHLNAVAAAYRLLIIRGKPGMESVLIKALKKHGTMTMARDFLNCGNNRLVQTAREWAAGNGCWSMVHGYPIISPSAISGPQWGELPHRRFIESIGKPK